MVRRTLADRFAALDQPDQRTDEEEVWGLVRAVLSITRVVVFLGMILISEMFEEFFFRGLSASIWALILGIPLFFVISVAILLGDSWFKPSKEEETSVVRPILKRI
jgi:hypothetical protein